MRPLTAYFLDGMTNEIAHVAVDVNAAGSVPEIASATVTVIATIAAVDDEADARLVLAAVVAEAEVAEDVIDWNGTRCCIQSCGYVDTAPSRIDDRG